MLFGCGCFHANPWGKYEDKKPDFSFGLPKVPEYPEKTRVDTRRTCELHRMIFDVRQKANACTAMLPRLETKTAKWFLDLVILITYKCNLGQERLASGKNLCRSIDFLFFPFAKMNSKNMSEGNVASLAKQSTNG